MAADCHYAHRSSYQHEFLHQVDQPIWKACAGAAIQIPAVGSRVYYFPQGHMEHSSAPQSVISAVCHLPPMPFVPCRVLQVLHLADSDTDEVYARIRLEPLANSEFFSVNRPPFSPPALGEDGDARKDERAVVVSFAKVLTPSDANNGGGFSVPKFCADSVFPPLDFAADPPVQMVTITDVRGERWTFRHIYRGTPRRHLLTTGWSKFVNSKKLISGDSVVFMRNKKTEKLFVGIRRAPKSNQAFDMSRWARQYVAMPFPGRMKVKEGGSDGGEDREGVFLSSCGKGKVPPEAVAEAVGLAANNMPFEVIYYPTALSRDFVVAAEKVDEAMGVYWTAGMRIKMAMEMEDSTRMTWIQGTVSCVAVPDYGSWQRSPWRMLQVAWDEPEALENLKRVSPWQVELMLATPSIDVAFPVAKRFRLPQNHGLLTDGEAYLSLPRTGFSNSMIGRLNPSYLNYNTFPAGMQGARQDTLSISSFANIIGNGTRQAFHVGHANNNLVQKVETVPTDLSMGSSQSDILSLDSLNSIPSTSPDFTGRMAKSCTPKAGITSFQLFGQTIATDSPVEGNDHGAGSKDYYADKGNKEKDGLRNPLGNRISDPCMKLLDRIGVPCPTSPAVEARTLSMAS